jgi:hypothetical protein
MLFNPLVAFYDIYGKEREVPFFCSVPDTTWDTDINIIVSRVYSTDMIWGLMIIGGEHSDQYTRVKVMKHLFSNLTRESNNTIKRFMQLSLPGKKWFIFDENNTWLFILYDSKKADQIDFTFTLFTHNLYFLIYWKKILALVSQEYLLRCFWLFVWGWTGVMLCILWILDVECS